MTPGGWDGRGDVGYNQEGAQWQTDADAYRVSVSSDGADMAAGRPQAQQQPAYGAQPGMRPISTGGTNQAAQNVQRPQDPRYNVPTRTAPGPNVARRSDRRHNVQTKAGPLPVHSARPMTARVLGPTWW